MNRFTTITLLSASLLCAGCGQQPSSSQTLVVDPVPVAKSLGRDEMMKKQLDSAIEQLNAQVRRHSEDLSNQVEKEKAKLGKNPNESDMKKLNELVAAASQSIKQMQFQARQKAADYRGTLLSGFNNELREAAAEIAKARGAKQVMIVDESVLWFDPATDITADVIAKLRNKANDAKPAQPEASAADQEEIKKLGTIVEEIEQQEQTSDHP